MFYNLNQYSHNPALMTAEGVISYKELQELANQYKFAWDKKGLVLILCNNEVENIAAYIAAFQQQHAVMLLNSTINRELLADIIETYKPNAIVHPKLDLVISGYSSNGVYSNRNSIEKIEIYQDLALMLSTSGTTGSQKFVRLSYQNLQANAESIAAYLELDEHERAIMNLPLAYSYGLSIINSHFLVGAAVVLTEESVIAKPFWELVKKYEATSIPGVPYTYQLLQRIGFTKMELPHLKTMTQAGGRLDTKLVQLFAQYAKEQQKRFYVMYGQTEASPRISYVPYSRILEKQGSIGIAIPNGSLKVLEETGELVYYGQNVMLGYATSLADLSKGDECDGVLYTGDVASIDDEGYVTIIGRMKRFIKLYGLRINLDEIEKKLELILQKPVACVGNDDQLKVAIEDEALVPQTKSLLQEWYKLHHTAFRVKVVEAIPRFSNGKINYQALKDE